MTDTVRVPFMPTCDLSPDALVRVADGEVVPWSEVLRRLAAASPHKEEAMTGFLATLTEPQRKAALDYCGPDTHPSHPNTLPNALWERLAHRLDLTSDDPYPVSARSGDQILTRVVPQADLEAILDLIQSERLNK